MLDSTGYLVGAVSDEVTSDQRAQLTTYQIGEVVQYVNDEDGIESPKQAATRLQREKLAMQAKIERNKQKVRYEFF